MKPILFPKNATTFTTNGIGRLSDAVSCIVTEELNGQYELEMRYPVDGKYFSEIGMNSIIMSTHEDSDDMQPFEVYKITKPINGIVTIYAHHISYRLSHCVAMPFTVPSGANACANTLAGLKSNAAVSGDVSLFSFWTDVHTVGTYNQAVPASIKSRLGGVEGSVLDQFGGEYEWDGFNVKLHVQRGSANTGFILKYGKNITDIEQEEELSNVITGVVPYWANMDGTDKLTLTEKVIYSPYVGNYPYHLTVPLDLSDQWQEKPSEATLRSAAQAYVNKSSLGVPKVSIKLSFVALWQTEEYKDIAPLEQVKMGDAVKVYFETLEIEAQARVVGTKYNVLVDRYDEVQIGSIRSTLAQTLNDQEAKTIQTIEATKQQVSIYADDIVNKATAWLTSAGGYVIAIKNTDGSWKELIFSNMTDPYDADAKILRVNNNGIGFSQHGMNGLFTNAWTIDGNLVADFIHGGTLTLGGNNNGNGWLKIVGANGSTVIGKWDKDGIDIDSGDINIGNGVFHVTSAGALTATSATITGAIKATSGEIGSGNSKFTITGNHIANGKSTLTDAKDGVYVGTDGIALGKSSKFKVTNDGALTATNATLTGTINNVNGNNTVSMANGQMVLNNNTAHNAIHMTNASNELVSMGADDVYYTDNDELFLQTSWSDLVDVGAHRDKLKTMYNQYMGGGW
jgi:phage minor structural protein